MAIMMKISSGHFGRCCYLGVGALVALGLMAGVARAADIDLGSVPAGVDPAAIQKLYADAIAKGEKQVVIVSNDRRFGPLVEFTKRFPGITISNDVVSAVERVTLIISQHRARHMQYDLVEGTGGVLDPLNQTGAFIKTDYAALGYPADDVIANLGIYADSVQVHAYNTNVVKKEDLPKKLEDFEDPRWKGKLVADPFSYASGASYEGLTHDEAYAVKTATDIRDASGLVLTGTAQDLINSGEKSFFLFDNVTRVIQAQKAGAPVALLFLEGMGVGRFGIGMTTLSPNPDAAKLFIYWIHTPEGQAAMFEHSSAALAKNSDSPISRLVENAHSKFTFETEQNWKERGRLTGVIQKAVTQAR
jgi:iron(III) transport system substrate-binding protein